MGFVPSCPLLEIPLDSKNHRQRPNRPRIGNSRNKRRFHGRVKKPRVTVPGRSRNHMADRPSATVERRVRTLKALVPNGQSITGLDGLFTETAHYILCLEMRVRMMQMVVDVLTGSSDE